MCDEISCLSGWTTVFERELDGDRGQEGSRRRWGIGLRKATAELLAKRGASVAVLDRPQSKGKEVADAIGGTFHEVDVTDFDGTEKVLQQAIDGLGGLHIIVTTAGGGIGERTVKKDGPHSLESFRKYRRPQPHRHLQYQ